MPDAIKVTDSQDEQNYEDLFRDSDQVHVPPFQREYVWTLRELKQFVGDINLILDDQESLQFLGAIVTYERPRDAAAVGRLKTVAVVDGQQRLLTVMLFIAAIAENLADSDAELAASIVKEHLLIPPRTGLSANTRIVPAIKDRGQFAEICRRLNDKLREHLTEPWEIRPPPAGESATTGRLMTQYRRILKLTKPHNEELVNSVGQLEEELDGTQLGTPDRLLQILIGKLQFVVLKLYDASVANKIFERLNYAGVRVDILGLVRNDVFARVQDPDEASRTHEAVWRPFELRLGDFANGFFFPYCLIHNSNTKKSEMFHQLRRTWAGLRLESPRQVVDHLDPFVHAYMAVVAGRVDATEDDVAEAVLRLHRMDCPAAAYPFVMKILLEHEAGRLSTRRTADLLVLVEWFLVRRALCGFEPTGLHAVFKTAWEAIAGNPTQDAFREFVKERPTIQWPTDAAVSEAVRVRHLAKANICGYLLVELDRLLPGDHTDAQPSIEHILPQEIRGCPEWEGEWSREAHEEALHTLANLVPMSGELNSSMQNAPYIQKARRYQGESMYLTPRRVVSEFPNRWSPAELEQRANSLASIVVERWKY